MESPSPFASDASWRRQLRARVSTWWRVKMVSNMLGMAAFFVAYFWVLHHPRFPITVMPLTPFDQWVPFEPAAMALYVSLWLYVSLPLALLKNPRELVSFGVATLALSATGLAIFLAYPTAVPGFDIDWSRYPSVAFLKAVDVGDNACPSLHVAFAVFTGVWLERLLREMNVGWPVRVLNAAWCAGILYSTLATRQHVALDVLAGASLGLFVVALQLRGLDLGHARAQPRAVEVIGTAAGSVRRASGMPAATTSPDPAAR